jgi:tRNA dimethylallyltransferase
MTLIVFAGPTGSGKSEIAERIAWSRGSEIVNYDSVQIYRGFDIGSAKPSAEERARIPHHLFDLVDPVEEFNAADYARAASLVCDDIEERGRDAIFVGGTFFYLRALLSGLPEMPGRNEPVRMRLRRISIRKGGAEKLHHWLRRVDPESAKRIAAADRHRVERALEVWVTSGRPISSWTPPDSDGGGERPALKIALRLEREALIAALDARVGEMYRRGLVEETRELLRRYPREARPFGTIGYREAAAVVSGELNFDEAIEETKRRTRAYAKRQMTWLRSERNVQWVDAEDRTKAFQAALRLIEGES